METADNDSLKQLDKLLAASNQSWLFGAGVSVNAGIPLMRPLTSQVFAKAKSDDEEALAVLNAVKEELPDESHIEHILSQLCDYATIAERSKEKKVTVGTHTMELDMLRGLHGKILIWIAETIRLGVHSC